MDFRSHEDLQTDSSGKVFLVAGSIVLIAMLLCLVVAAAAAWSYLRPQTASVPPTTPPQNANVPALAPSQNTSVPAPTPVQNACAPPRLAVGDASYRIESISRPADGSVPAAPDDPQVAYWLEGTGTHPVFLLGSAGPLIQIADGELATITWADCAAQSYHVSALQPASLDDPALFDQAREGVTILIPTGPGGQASVVRGAPEEAEFQEYELFQPRPEELLASVSMEQVLAPPGGGSIQVDVTILNYGVSEFTLLASDVGLFPEDAAPLGLTTSEPALPQVLGPGQSQYFSFTFPRPASGLGVLRVFNVEYNLEDFK